MEATFFYDARSMVLGTLAHSYAMHQISLMLRIVGRHSGFS